MIQIGGLERSTLIDYPGRVAATVFLIGCNFRCPWCYNPELVLPEKIRKKPNGAGISEKEFFKFLKERKGLLEGLCITGGEPTLNKDLPDFIKKIKKTGYLVKLDTNGSNPAMLKKLISEKLIDYVAMDIKGPLEKYRQITRKEVDLEKIKRSVGIINKFPNHEFRTTILPRFHRKEDMINIALWLKGSKKYFLQQFRPGKTLDSSFEKEKAYSSEELNEIFQTIRPYFDYCGVRE